MNKQRSFESKSYMKKSLNGINANYYFKKFAKKPLKLAKGSQAATPIIHEPSEGDSLSNHTKDGKENQLIDVTQLLQVNHNEKQTQKTLVPKNLVQMSIEGHKASSEENKPCAEGGFETNLNINSNVEIDKRSKLSSITPSEIIKVSSTKTQTPDHDHEILERDEKNTIDLCCKDLLEMGTSTGKLFAFLLFKTYSLNPPQNLTLEQLSQLECVKENFKALSLLEKQSAEPDESKMKSKVRFCSFNLSSICLDYSLGAEKFVEFAVNELARSIETMQSDNFVASISPLFDRVDLLYSSKKLDKTWGVGSGIFPKRFTVEDLAELQKIAMFYFSCSNELQLNGRIEYFKNRLKEMMSTLLASIIRYRLRVLFEPFDVDLKEGETHDIPYPNQDFGGAVHRGLNEFHIHKQVIVDTLNREKTSIMCSDDEIDSFERYMIASKFLKKVILDHLLPCEQSKAKLKLSVWQKLKCACHFINRLGLQDEEHLIPLENPAELLEEIESRENRLQLICATIEKQKSISSLSKTSKVRCATCNKIISSNNKCSVTCDRCDGSYHLRCLDLPNNYNDFTLNYTCPKCLFQR